MRMSFIQLITAAPSEGANFNHFSFLDVNPLGGRSKRRRLSDPSPEMRVIHNHLIDCLRRLPVDLTAATGARKGHSAITNIAPHRDSRYFLLLDIKNAYGSTNKKQLVDVLLGLDPSLPRNLFGESALLEDFLDRHCLDDNGGLLTGAPASPDLYNIYVGVLLDQRLMELCKRYSLVYTRYLDDITLSSKAPIGKKKRQAIYRTIREAGLVIHEQKTQLHDLRRGPIKITGFMLNYDRRITLPRGYLSKVRGYIHLAIKNGWFDKKNEQKINGMMAQLDLSVQVPRKTPRKKGQKRYRRFLNETERKARLLHRKYLGLCRESAIQ